MAFGGAFVVHLLVLGAMLDLATSSEHRVIVPADTAGVSVTLEGFDGGRPARSRPPAPDPLLALQRQLSADTPTPDQPADRPRTPLSLAELLGEDRPAVSPGQVGARRAGGDPGAQVSSVVRGGAGLTPARPAGQPCWRRPARAVAVRMEVMLDEQGDMIGRPKVLSSSDAASLNEAMRSLAGCGPFVLASPGRYRLFQLDFAAGKRWAKAMGDVEVR